MGKHGRYCFKVALMKKKKKKNKNVKELLIIVHRKKRAQIESLVIYRKNNFKKHNKISVEKILNLFF